MLQSKFKPEGFLSKEKEQFCCQPPMEILKSAFRSGSILESFALLCDTDLNLYFDFGGVKLTMPKEECCFASDGAPLKDIAIITRVGKPCCFKVTDIDEDNYTATVSRRLAQLECADKYISSLSPGDILPVKITHLEAFGAFADIGCGISALMPIDSISVSRLNHPKNRLRSGDNIYAVVKSHDRSNGRIYLTHKELLGTWEENAAMFSVGQTVAGTVRSIESYGIFVELTPNLTGLAELRGDDMEYDIEVGDSVAVYIKSIIPDKMKVKLVIIDHSEGAKNAPAPIYFTDCRSVSHISSWRYSPPSCTRIIESIFD